VKSLRKNDCRKKCRKREKVRIRRERKHKGRKDRSKEIRIMDGWINIGFWID
jgi:hypothetical protein